MRIGAALSGDLEEIMKDELQRGERAVSVGTGKTVDALKNHLRGLTLTAFGSQRLANAWRGNVYPRLPKYSLGAAGTVHSNAPHIIEAFSRAVPIVSKDGFWLAIPSPDAPRQFLGKRVSPSNWNDERYGPLRFIYRSGKSALLVVDAVKRNSSGKIGRRLNNGGFSFRSGQFAKGWSTVVMFYLVPMVRLKKVFDLEADYARAHTDLLDNIIAAWSDPA